MRYLAPSRENTSTDSEVLEIEGHLIFFSYVIKFVVVLGFVGFLSLFWRDMFLVNTGRYFHYDSAGVTAVWPLFILPALMAIVGRRTNSFSSRGTLLGRAVWLSLNAGIWEELIYRWLFFLGAMVMIPFFNLITFGLVKLLYVHLLIPFTNFATFGMLDSYLHSSNWVLGAAIVSASASFRDAHEKHGFFGKIIVWYAGVVLFWVMFNYGIATAMAVHTLYDLIVFVPRALKSRAVRAFDLRWL